jgi:hypothetical protein
MRVFVLALLLTVVSPSWAGIGTVSENKGTACEVERNKKKISGVKGAEIESMDTYTTGACTSNITFKDDTKVKVTENSRLLIDDFVFDPKKSDAGKLALNLSFGSCQDSIDFFLCESLGCLSLIVRCVCGISCHCSQRIVCHCSIAFL